MVDLDRLMAKFEMLDRFLGIIKSLSQTETEKFTADPILVGSMRYYLQVSIECCLDVAAHVISSERYRAPKDYADTFTVLEEKEILPTDLAQKLRQMAKFRNRLVHLYGEIDDHAVHRIAGTDIKDMVQFKTVILNRFSDETS